MTYCPQKTNKIWEITDPFLMQHPKLLHLGILNGRYDLIDELIRMMIITEIFKIQYDK